MCHKQDNAHGGIKKADPFSVALSQLYGPVARYRVKNLETRFPVEPLIIGELRRIMGRGGL